jgi:hypothetical protein
MVPSIKNGLEKSRVFSMDQHRETGVDSQTSGENLRDQRHPQGIPQIIFADRVTIREIGETMNKGEKAPFWSL